MPPDAPDFITVRGARKRIVFPGVVYFQGAHETFGRGPSPVHVLDDARGRPPVCGAGGKARRIAREVVSGWQEYQKTGLHVTGEDVLSWLDTWGTDEEEPPPVCHK